jgi:hypothetical protein
VNRWLLLSLLVTLKAAIDVAIWIAVYKVMG